MPDAPHRMGDETREAWRQECVKRAQSYMPGGLSLAPGTHRLLIAVIAALDDGDALRAELAEARERERHVRYLLSRTDRQLKVNCSGWYPSSILSHGVEIALEGAVLDEASVSEETKT